MSNGKLDYETVKQCPKCQHYPIKTSKCPQCGYCGFCSGQWKKLRVAVDNQDLGNVVNVVVQSVRHMITGKE